LQVRLHSRFLSNQDCTARRVESGPNEDSVARSAVLWQGA
jgi:hypothetical protein